MNMKRALEAIAGMYVDEQSDYRQILALCMAIAACELRAAEAAQAEFDNCTAATFKAAAAVQRARQVKS
jgi:hypothetical protein